MNENPFEGFNGLSAMQQGTAALHEFYTELVNAGFTEDQAIHLVAAAIQEGTK